MMTDWGGDSAASAPPGSSPRGDNCFPAALMAAPGVLLRRQVPLDPMGPMAGAGPSVRVGLGADPHALEFCAPNARDMNTRTVERRRMSNISNYLLSRRATLGSLLAAAAYGAFTGNSTFAEPIRNHDAPANGVGPVFSETGPYAKLYGAAEGFPVPGFWARLQGNPYEPQYRVGAFSHFDELYRIRRVRRASAPWSFKRSQTDIRYLYPGNQSSVVEYLSRNPVTGLLIAKDEQILFEHYQYGRTDRDRFISQSMVKSIIGLLIGIAVSDGVIKSVDDLPEAYVPGFIGTEYGKTPIRDLLHMSSGVEFREEEDSGRDLKRLWSDMVSGSWIFPKGTIKSITQFNRRIAPPGTKYFYASIEPDVLGVVLHDAVNKSASAYLQERVWEPIGAEADATWLVDAEGFEVAHFGFSAVLRDYARLGRLFAHDGVWEGKQIVPSQWMIDATSTRPSDAYLAPGTSVTDFDGLWLPVVAASWGQTPIRDDWNSRAICLCRSSLEASHGPDSPQRY
jgi:CubicO group peptidase (beta-lactamase class C family)